MSGKNSAKKKNQPSSSDVTDVVKQYLKEVSKVPLLTLEEEILYTNQIVDGLEAEAELAEQLDIPQDLLHFLIWLSVDPSEKSKRTEYGLYVKNSIEDFQRRYGRRSVDIAREKLNVKNLTKEQKRLLIKAKEGEIAREKLISANVRLVIANAKKLTSRGALDLSDLIQSGNLGLLRAVEKFDPSRGFKFSTYATWWIKQAIDRAIADQSRTIRLPVHIIEQLRKMNDHVLSLQRTLGRRPTIAEIAEKAEIPEQKVKELLSFLSPIMSLDEPRPHINDQQREHTIGDVIDAPASGRPEPETELSLLRESLFDLINKTLDQQEAYVIKARWGLIDSHNHTLEEVGTYLGVTRERVRQIEGRALRKLKASVIGSGLETYLLEDPVEDDF